MGEITIDARVSGEILGQSFTGRVVSTSYVRDELYSVSVESDSPVRSPAGRMMTALYFRTSIIHSLTILG